MHKRYVLSSGMVNRYKYRIVPEGLKLENYRANNVILYNHKGSSVGKMLDLQIIDGKLTGIPEFDLDDENGKDLDRKYRKGYLNAFSIYHEPIKVSDDKALLMEGQTRATVIESELLEVSAVDVPGDAGAVRHALSNDQSIDDIIPMLTLSNNNKVNPKMKSILKALGLSEGVSEADAVKAVKQLKSQLSLLIKEALDTLIAKGEEEGIITADNKLYFEKLAATDFDTAKGLIENTKLEKKPNKKEEPENLTLSALLNAVKGNEGSVHEEKETFEYLSKNNPEKLNKLRLEDPEKYKQLVSSSIGAKG